MWTDIGGPIWIYSSAYDAVHDLLYIGTVSNGTWKYDGATWTDTELGPDVPNGWIIWALVYDAANDLLYAGTEDHGVWAYDGSTWTDTGGAVATFGVWCLVRDDVHDLLYAGTGEFVVDTGYSEGVWKYDGATWTSVSVLGANVLSADDSGLEAGVGGWHDDLFHSCTVASSTDWASAGTHSLKVDPILYNSGEYPGYYFKACLDVTAATSPGDYTVKCKFKGIATKWYCLEMYDDVSGVQLGPNFLSDGAEKTLTMAATFGAGSTYREISVTNASAHDLGEVAYFDVFTVKEGIDTSTLTVSSLAYDPENNILYAGPEPYWYGEGQAGIWKCANPNTAPVWTQFDDVAKNKMYFLAFDDVHNLLYAACIVTTPERESDGVWSYDGLNWTNLGMEDHSFWALTYDAIQNIIYASFFETGAACWKYDGYAWNNISENLLSSNVLHPCETINVSDTRIYRGTWDEGVWWMDPFVLPAVKFTVEEKKSAYVSILDPTGATPLARLTEHFPTTGWTPDIFENLSLESVNRGGYTVASFSIHRPVTQFWADLQYRNQVIIGRGSEIYWEGYIAKPIRSIRPDVIEVACLGWSAELNQLWTASDITAPVGGYKMSTFINAVLLADPNTSIVAGAIETGDYAYPEGTVFAFAPNKYYSDALEELDAGNNFNWGVWGNKAIDLRAKHSSVDWLVWTGDCEDLTISPNPEALCNYVMANFTQDGIHDEQVIVQDAGIGSSQEKYGTVIMQRVDIPGKIDESSGGAGIPGGATHIAEVYLAEHKDLKVAAEFTCNRIFDSYGAEQYLGKVKGGEVVRIVDWLPTEEALGGVSNVATFEIKSPKYDHDNDTLAITPTEFLPSTDIQIARLQATGY